ALPAVSVFDPPEDGRDRGFDGAFFAQFANERGLHPLTGFDVAARQEEPGPGALSHDQEPSVAADDGAGEELGGGDAHEVSFVSVGALGWWGVDAAFSWTLSLKKSRPVGTIACSRAQLGVGKSSTVR